MPDRRWFDVYTRMLEETVRELPAEKVPVKIHSSLNLGLDLRIPATYISDENQRFGRISGLRRRRMRRNARRWNWNWRTGMVRCRRMCWRC